jgi:hypothetical protein
LSKRARITRSLISIGIAFHLLVILLLPNGSSYLQRDLLPVLLPYSNTFGLTSKWQFFAPDPEQPNYLEYEIDWKSGPPDANNETVYRFPPAKEGFFDFVYTRRNSIRAYMTLDRNFMSTVFISWVCRQNPEAAGVSVRQAVVNVPSLAEVQNGQPLYNPTNVRYEEAVTASCDEALRGG